MGADYLFLPICIKQIWQLNIFLGKNEQSILIYTLVYELPINFQIKNLDENITSIK